MSLIKVTTEDHMAIVESLARRIWTKHYTPIIGKEQVEYMLAKFQSLQAIATQISEGVLYYLMQQAGEDIGYLAVQPKGNVLFLSKIYVRASFRGKGFGKKAIEFAEKFASEQGLRKITLTVNTHNINSIKAYEKWGFSNRGALVQDIGGGFVMDDYKMEKVLE